MVNHIIAYTRHDGGVDICGPTDHTFQVFQSGGWWDDYPGNLRGFVDVQVERQIKSGINHDYARRFAEAVAFGGVIGHEAWDLIRGRDCGHRGYNFVKLGQRDLPDDKWFRNAWVQNSNGAVCVDLRKARTAQVDRIKKAVKGHNAARLALGRKPAEPPWWTLWSAIRHAANEDELRRVWPSDISRSLG